MSYGPGELIDTTTYPYDGSALVNTGVTVIDIIGGGTLLVAVGVLLWYGGSQIKRHKRKGFTDE